jgi:hypothetical protein
MLSEPNVDQSTQRAIHSLSTKINANVAIQAPTQLVEMQHVQNLDVAMPGGEELVIAR